MELVNLNAEMNTENIEIERAVAPLQQLQDLELCLVGGGMGDVLQ